MFLGYALVAVRLWKGDITVADNEELWNLDESEISRPKTQCKRKINVFKRWYFHIPVGRNHEVREFPEAGSIRNGSGSLRRTSRELGEVSTNRNTCRRWSPQWLLVNRKWLQFTVTTLNLDFISTCRKKNHSQLHWSVSTWPGQLTQNL